MRISRRWMDGRLRAPEGEGAGGGAAADAEAGADAAAAAAAAAGQGDPPPADGGAGARPWYDQDGFLSGEERDWIKAKGMAVDDQGEVLRRAIKGHMSAEKRLGKPGDALMDKPAKDEAATEWRRRNAAALGIPETAEQYEIAPPKDFPAEAWDKGLEGKVREFAAARALPQDVVQGFAGLYAEHIHGMIAAVEQELQVASGEMQRDLERDWGDQYPARVAVAQAGAAALAAKAGIEPQQLEGIAALLRPKLGDAGIMRLFHAAGEALADDGIVGGAAGAGATTPQDARAKLAQFTSSEGDYGRAYAAGDHRRMRELEPERQRLVKLSAPGR